MTYAKMIKNTIACNGFARTVVTTPEGRKVSIKPCAYGDIEAFEDAEFYLIDVYGTDVPFYGSNTIDEVIDTLVNVERIIADIESEREECREYFEEHEADGWDSESAEFYSDWHKDLFGYRPHGHIFGVYVNPHAR